MELAPDTIVAGKLRVIRRLGAGGVGEVWEVEHTLTRHRRALKVLHPRFANRQDVIERFLREASAAGRIGDPHICETFDAGRLDSQAPYLLMELLEGTSFGDRLRQGRVELPEVAFIVRQACLGVAAAHEASIVHRDLKPDNLFLTSVEGKAFVKVLDFGVSRFDELGPGEQKLTSEGTTLGTPLYMSPEQISGRADLDKRADVYALGVILYEAVAGKPPFDGNSVAALAVQIHRGKAPSLKLLCPELPADFVAVVERAMASDRDMRFDDARQLFDALAPFEIEPELEHTAPRQLATPGPATPAPATARRSLGPALALVVAIAIGAAALVALRSGPAPVVAPPPLPPAPTIVKVLPEPQPAVAVPVTPIVEVAPAPTKAPPRPAKKPKPNGLIDSNEAFGQ